MRDKEETPKKAVVMVALPREQNTADIAGEDVHATSTGPPRCATAAEHSINLKFTNTASASTILTSINTIFMIPEEDEDAMCNENEDNEDALSRSTLPESLIPSVERTFSESLEWGLSDSSTPSH